MGQSAKWQVGAILREPLHVTLGFVSWFLDHGADRITILFDDPDDPAIPILSGDPRVQAIACDDAFWSGIGLKPTVRFVRRQNLSMTWLYNQCRDGWFLNVDGDELVYSPNGGIGELLAAQPGDVLSLRIATAEIIRLPETGGHAFRLQMDDVQRRRVYGEDVDLFPGARRGLLGHSDGKSFTRCGLDVQKLRQHWPVASDGARVPQKMIQAKDGVHLLHLIGEDFPKWREKVEWRNVSHGFPETLKPQIVDILAAPDREERLRDLYERLHCADGARVRAMADEGVLLEVQPDLERRIQRRFGKITHPPVSD